MIMAKIFRYGGCLAVLGLPVYPVLAQDWQPVRGPVMGFVLDDSAAVRPILGIPGAATLGGPAFSLAGFDKVVFSPQRDYALARTRSGARPALLKDLGRLLDASLLDLPPGPDRIVTSPSGDTAAFYYTDSRTVMVVAGLPGSPSVSWTIELPDLAGGLVALAVSDGGVAVLAAGGEQVILLTPDIGPRHLCAVDGSPSLAFFVNSLDAVVADGVLNRVMTVRDPKGAAQITQIADASQGVSQPVAVAVTGDNRRVLVANAEPAGVVTLSLAGESPVTLPCNCKLTGLERLAGSAAFRLSEPGEAPLWLLDAGDSPPRLVFVPNQAPTPRRPARLPLPVRRGGER